jgi:Hydrolase of X-linked nucleoside diphosphate N terminal
LEWVRRLQAIAQSGLTYAKDPYDAERYEQVRRIAAEIAASRSGTTADSILHSPARIATGVPLVAVVATVCPEANAVATVVESLALSRPEKVNPGRSECRRQKTK